MATIEEYVSGKAAKAVKTAYDAMAGLESPLPQTPLAAIFETALSHLEPLKMNLAQASGIIKQAARCAIGERICRCEFPDSPVTRSVFLDELAQALVNAGKAEFVTGETAIEVLAAQKGKPIVMSKVSEKYMEICRTFPGLCFYWNAEKNGLKCIRPWKDG